MCIRDREYYLADYKKRSDTLSKKEQDTLRDMRIVQEMYARGFDFVPIDIYKAKARHFQIIDGKMCIRDREKAIIQYNKRDRRFGGVK